MLMSSKLAGVYLSEKLSATWSAQAAATGAAGLYLDLGADALLERRNMRDYADQLAILLQT